jgi:hypothetical protein
MADNTSKGSLGSQQGMPRSDAINQRERGVRSSPPKETPVVGDRECEARNHAKHGPSGVTVRRRRP